MRNGLVSLFYSFYIAIGFSESISYVLLPFFFFFLVIITFLVFVLPNIILTLDTH